jgi:hypothetical protein
MIRTNNVLDKPYLDVCHKHHIKSFRGKETAYIYTSKKYKNWYLFKILRLIDSYSNITGYNTYKVESLYKNILPLNLPSSGILRAYSKPLYFLEPIKLLRIKKAMKYAARNHEMFHLWFHPHNFGNNTKENFKNLEAIFKEYSMLNKTYKFSSETMTSLANKTILKHQLS